MDVSNNVSFETWVDGLSTLISQGSFEKLQEKKSELKTYQPLITPHVFDFWNTYMDGLHVWHVDHQPYTAYASLKKAYEIAFKLSLLLQIRIGMAWEIWHVESGQFDQALKINSDTQALAEKAAPSPLQAGILINRARIAWRLGDLTTAQYCLDKALTILESSNHPYKARGYNTQGIVYLHERAFAGAKTSFENAIKAAEASHSDGPKMDALCNLGYLSYRAEAWAEATQYLLAAKELAIATDDVVVQGETDMYLGAVALHLENFDQAKLLLEDAKNKFNEAQVNAFLPELHLYLADLAEKQGQPTDALAKTKVAIDYAEDLIEKIKNFSQHHKLIDASLLAYEQYACRLLRQAPQKNLADVFYWIERSKSRILNEMLAARQLRRPDDVAIEDFERERFLAQRYYLSLDLPYADEHSNERHETLKKELDALRARIALGSATYRSKNITPYSLASIQAKMPANSVLLEYFSLNEQFYLYVATPQHAEIIDLELTRDDIESQFLHHNGHWLLQDIFPTALGGFNVAFAQDRIREWGQLFLSPAATWLKTAEIVCIVPHDLLHHFPLHALPIEGEVSDDSTHYLANGIRRVIYAPSAALLFGYCQEKLDSPYISILAAGNNQATRSQFSPLQHAEAIAKLAATMFGQHSRLLVGQAATQAAIIEFANRYRYILFACHGQFDATNPLQSSLALADAPLNVDRILKEVACHADLVVLSACETGVSRVLKGDELLGFARAFLYAGARALLMTLWKVDEFSTRLLMEKFFSEIAYNNAPPSLALSQAQHYLRTLTVAELRKLVKSQNLSVTLDHLTYPDHHLIFEHPFYWAAFYLVGEKLVQS